MEYAWKSSLGIGIFQRATQQLYNDQGYYWPTTAEGVAVLSTITTVVMQWWSKLLSAIFKATETLGGTPVILLVRHHSIMKSLAHQSGNLKVNMF